MKELLEAFFGKHYQSTKQETADCHILKGLFTQTDSKACGDCRTHSPAVEVDCDKVVLKCNSSEQLLEVIELEKFINKYAHLKALPSGRKCDLLLVGKDKIVLCDMTCSKAKFIDPFTMKDGTPKIGKRNVAKEQICCSIKLLMEVPEIAADINQKKDKIALFAYREKPKSVNDDFYARFSGNMRLFKAIEDKAFREPMFSDVENGFLFAEVRYPDTYYW